MLWLRFSGVFRQRPSVFRILYQEQGVIERGTGNVAGHGDLAIAQALVSPLNAAFL